jgi:hypothetical protein
LDKINRNFINSNTTIYMLRLTIRAFPLQDQIVRLNKENGSLKQNLVATNAALSASRVEGSRASTSGTSSMKVVLLLYSNFWVLDWLSSHA